LKIYLKIKQSTGEAQKNEEAWGVFITLEKATSHMTDEASSTYDDLDR